MPYAQPGYKLQIPHFIVDAFVCFVRISQENSIDQLVYNREGDCLLRGTVRGFLHYLVKILPVGRTMAPAISCWPLTEKVRVRSHLTCGGQNGTMTGLPHSTLVLPCQYISIKAPYSSASTRWSYQKEKMAKCGNFRKSNTILKIGEHWIEKYFPFFTSKELRDKQYVTMFEIQSPGNLLIPPFALKLQILSIIMLLRACIPT